MSTDAAVPMTIAASLYRLFANRTDAYGKQQPAGTYIKISSNVNEELIDMHLKGKITIGMYCLDKANTVKWLCFDIDDHEKTGRDCPGIVQKIVQYLREKYGLIAYVEASGSDNSYHVWVFLKPSPAGDVLAFGEQVISELNISDIEIFPKQSSIEENGFGNLVKLPMGINKKSDKRSFFLSSDTMQPLGLDDAITLLSNAKMYSVPQDVNDATNNNNANDKSQIYDPDTFEPRNTETELKQLLSKCRTCFISILTVKKDMHGAQGREYMLAVCTDLKAAGATEQHIKMFARLIYEKKYDEARTLHEWSNIDPAKTWRCDVLKAKLPSYIDTVQCDQCAQRRKSYEDPGMQEKALIGGNGVTTDNHCGSCRHKPNKGTGFCRLPENRKSQKYVTLETRACEKFLMEVPKEKARSRADKMEELSPTPEVAPHILARAEEIMTLGKPFEFIIDVQQTMHKGDRQTAESLLVSVGCQSAVNTEGLHDKVSGFSGTGKTHCVKAVVHLLPSEWVMAGDFSDKAPFYFTPKPGTVIFNDDAILSEPMQGIIKRATSNYQQGTEYRTVTDQKPLELFIPPRITWWLTSVDDDQSVQLLNRMFGVGVDESPEQDKKVADFLLDQAAEGEVAFPENEDVEVCRQIIREIKKQLFSVKIPFARKIIWEDAHNRRNLSIFIDIIKSFAVLRFKQRPIVDGFLWASVEDFDDAKKLYCSRAENQGMKLTDVELRICRALHQSSPSDIMKIAQTVDLSRSRVHQLIHGSKQKPESGLVFKVKGLHFEKCSIKTGDSSVHKTYYSLTDFDTLGSYSTVVSLPEAAKNEFKLEFDAVIAKNGSGRNGVSAVNPAVNPKTSTDSDTVSSVIDNNNKREYSLTEKTEEQEFFFNDEVSLPHTLKTPYTANTVSQDTDIAIYTPNGNKFTPSIDGVFSYNTAEKYRPETNQKTSLDSINSVSHLEGVLVKPHIDNWDSPTDDVRIKKDELLLLLRKYHGYYLVDAKAGKLNSLAKKALVEYGAKIAFREYFLHNCPEFTPGQVDFGINILFQHGEPT